MIFYIQYLCLTDVFISIITLKFVSKQMKLANKQNANIYNYCTVLQIICYEYFTIDWNEILQ